jgi:hypothetical protein
MNPFRWFGSLLGARTVSSYHDVRVSIEGGHFVVAVGDLKKYHGEVSCHANDDITACNLSKKYTNHALFVDDAINACERRDREGALAALEKMDNNMEALRLLIEDIRCDRVSLPEGSKQSTISTLSEYHRLVS